MRPAPLLVIVLLSTAALAPELYAQEWPRFRGPDGSGVNAAADVPAQWTDKDYRWRIALPGGGHASPVLWGKKVFVACADDASAMRSVLCVSADDGAVIWRRDFPSRAFREHGDNSYASATPAADADHVYVCWSTPDEFTVVALDHAGRDAWKANLGPFVSQHGGGNSPVVYKDLVLVGDENEGHESALFALDRNTGRVKWKVPRRSDKFSAATPCVVDVPGAGPQVVFTSKREGITAVDPLGGAVRWSLPDVFDARTVGSPVAGAGLVFASCGEGPGGHVIVAARPGADGKPAAVAYTLREATPYVPTPLVRGDLLFYLADNGTLTCARAATGETVWRERLNGSFYSSPVCAGDKLFCVTKKGDVIACAAGEKFALLGRTSLGEKCHATPAVANGDLYVRTYTHLVCVRGAGRSSRGRCPA